jgi:N-methylhydantoinase A
MKVDYVLSVPGELSALNWEKVNHIFSEMSRKGKELLFRVGVKEHEVILTRMADMRYQGQGHEIVVPLPSAGILSSASIPEIKRSFEDTYRELYGRTIANVPIEALSFRLFASGPTPRIVLQLGKDSSGHNGEAKKGARLAYFPAASGNIETQVLDRYKLFHGYTGKGPAIIEERESTAIVPPGWRFEVDSNLCLRMEMIK